MRLFLATFAVLLVTSHAFVADVGNLDLKEEESAKSTYKGGELVGLLEKFRSLLRNGNATLGIPVLDPFQEQHMNVDLKKAGLVSVKGTLDNVRAAGLSNYKVDRGDFNLIGLKVNLAFTWEQLQIMTKYDVEGTLLDDLAFYGKGNIALDVRGLKVSVDLKMNVKDKKMYVRDVVLHAHLKQLNCNITGLYNDADMSDTVSQIVSEIVPGLLEDYQSKISEYGSPIVSNILNNTLQKFTLKDFLDMIIG